MNGTDAYESWKRARSEVEAPDGFSDGVMARLSGECAPPRTATPGMLQRLASRPEIAVSMLLVGLGVGVFRLGFLLLLVLFSSGKGF